MKKFFSALILYSIILPSAYSCDLLSVNIGGDRSGFNNIFGPFNTGLNNEAGVELEEEEYEILETTSDAFCKDIDLGEVLVYGYLVDGLIAGLQIEVQNYDNDKESKEGLLRSYVQNKYGPIDINDDKWKGYRTWNFGKKEIFYYHVKLNEGGISEGVYVTSPKYFALIGSDEIDE